ncbi:MAG: HAD family hydrolase [Anaerolineaceae bacterium]
MTLQAVFFDMGGTIETYRYDPGLRTRNAPLLRDMLTRNNIVLKMDDADLAVFISKGFAEYKKWSVVNLVELPPQQIWSRFIFKDDAYSGKFSATAAEELTFLYETCFHERSLRPEIPGVLARLRDMKLKIGCISNVASRTGVPFNLKKYGIIHYFHPIVLSSEYGRRKPDPAIFHHAANLAKLPTDVCVYIGDKISRDILGAKKAGFKLAIQVRHDFDTEHGRHEMEPDYYLQNIAELIPILEKEMNRPTRTGKMIIPENKKYKAIFFDAGDILYHRPNKANHLNDFLSQRGINPEKLDQAKRAKLVDAAYQGKLGRHEYYKKVLRLYGVCSAPDIEAGMLAMSKDDNTVEIMPDVPETLHKLKQKGYRLGIITDTALPIHIKLKWFDQAGFGDVWSTITSSKVLGYRKPNPKIYRHALEQAQVTAGEAIFVGHKETELTGAGQMGLTTVAFNYEKDAKADFFIEDFKDLPSLPILKS